MNIALVNATHSWGGVKTWMLDFAEQLAKRGHRIRVYGRQKAFADAARERVGHGEVVSFGPDCNPLTVLAFMLRFREEGIQAVLINVGKDLSTAGVAARLLGLPVVQFIGLPDDIPHKLKTTLLHRFVRPHFLSSCRFIEEGFLQSLPYLHGFTSRVILTAKTAGEHELCAQAPRRLVMTQQLHSDKGHGPLLRALAIVRDRLQTAQAGGEESSPPLNWTPFVLHIAGEGPLKEPLQQLVAELRLEQCVVWHGFVRNIPEFLRDKDIFLLGSFSEGLPNTLQEGMAEGLLPVIRNVGGVKEVIPPPLEPWVLPYEAGVDEFAEALERALTLDDTQLLHLRETARTACRERFDLATNARDMEAWLASLIGETPPASTEQGDAPCA